MQKNIIKNSLLAAASVLVVPIFAQVVVGAQPARAHEQSDATRQTSERKQKDTQERVAEIKQEVEQRKATVKQDVCERRQEQLTKIMPRLATGAISVKTAIDTANERVQGFYDSGQLTVSNYEELKAKVDVAKTDSEVALEVVTSYQFELDCENANVGEQLDAYRASITEAKDSLKAYRVALVDLISAMRASVAESREGDTADGIDSQETSTEQEEGETNDQ